MQNYFAAQQIKNIHSFAELFGVAGGWIVSQPHVELGVGYTSTGCQSVAQRHSHLQLPIQLICIAFGSKSRLDENGMAAFSLKSHNPENQAEVPVKFGLLYIPND